MTRQMQIQKWTVYGLVLLAVFLLDSALLRQLPIGGVTPLLLPLAATALANLEGGTAGAPFGMVAGILWAGAYSSHGMYIIALTLVGLFVGIATQYGLNGGFLSYLLCSSVVMVVITALQLGFLLFIRYGALSLLLSIAITQIFYSLAFTPLIYLMFHRAFRRVGGTKLA